VLLGFYVDCGVQTRGTEWGKGGRILVDIP
jgi:hypothetical protein